MMMNRLMQWLGALAAATVLSGCGGGSPGGTGGSGGSGGSSNPTISVVLASTTVTTSTPVKVSATVRNASGAGISGVVVTFGTVAGLGSLSPSSALTDSSGVAEVFLSPAVGVSGGADEVSASATVDGVVLSAKVGFQLQIQGASSGQPSLQVLLSPTNLSAATPSTVSIILRDGTGAPVSGAVVSLSTLRSNLATLNASSLLTDSLGAASAVLSSAGSGIQGADEVVAVATVGGTQVQGRVGYSVSAQSPTITLTPSSANLTFTTAPITLTARVRDAAGAAVANQPVQFAALNGLIRLGTPSVLTNSSGDAVVSISPVAASTSGTEIITASASVAGRDLEARGAVQITSQAPSLAVLSITNSTVTPTAPVTLRVAARDLSGNLVPNAVVSFSSQSNLAVFTPSSAVTDSNGEATTVVAPAPSSTNGADVLVASVTVQGIAATAQRVAQFVGSSSTGTPTLDLALSTPSISAATPATVTATLRDAQGVGVASQVVTFQVVRGLATTNVATALTNSSGVAVVVMSPTSNASAGADEVTASVSYAGSALQRTQGFAVQATPVTLESFSAGANPLSAYGQTNLTLSLTGASVTSPVAVTVSSSCVAQGKATLSPSSFTATSSSVTLQYRDNGCGAIQASDQLQAVVTATGASRSLSLTILSPTESSIAFVSATPEQIFLKGSGFTETSLLTFEVRDTAGNALPNKLVELRLVTGAGGVTMEGRGVESVNPPSSSPVTLTSNAQGRISARVNSGTVPTPVRVNARLASNTSIATVSSNLSVAVGLPSQLNFSLSQGSRNIEGYDRDGTANTYQIIAADRSGNPVAAGTSINFVSEGGQVEAIKQTQLVNGIARATANFVSASPRPVDGRVTFTAYALGEESFIDLNGNNQFDAGEPSQDLGRVFKDRNFDGVFDAAEDETIPLSVNDSGTCSTPSSNLLRLDASIPSRPATCDGAWSGAGQVYVRRAAETVLSTSAARPLWASTSGLNDSCSKIIMQIGPLPTDLSSAQQLTRVAGDTWFGGGATGTLSFIVADANPGSVASGLSPRLNPMAAGTTITATTPTAGLTVTVDSGSPVPSTSEASSASVNYNFSDPLVTSGVVTLTFTSPSGYATSYSIVVDRGTRATVCP